MKAFAVLAHPERNSFNGALFDVAADVFSGGGHEFVSSDLYRMQFDPVSDRRNFTSVKDPQYFKQQIEELHASENSTFRSDIAEEMEKLFWCDLLILQFPLWWFSMPAIMKGWVDRVFAMGRVYGSGKWYDQGVFSGKRAVLSLTTGGGSGAYAEDGLHGDLSQILYPINHGILRFVGFDVLPPFVSWSPVRISPEQRQDYLDSYRRFLTGIDKVEPLAYPALAEFDETFRRKSLV